MQAVILAGGNELALRPLTARVPRAMVPLANKPLVRYQIDLLHRHSVTDIVICVDSFSERFESYFNDPKRSLPGRIRLHRDTQPRGTAGALKAAQSLIDDDVVIVLNGHILSDVDISSLVEFHTSKAAAATVYLSPNSDPLRYGIALTDADGRIRSFVQKPGILDEAPTDTINAGIYVFNPSVLDQIPPGVQYSLEHSLFPALLLTGAPFYGFVSEAYWQDITSLPDYSKAQEDILTGRVEAKLSGHKEGERIWVAASASIHPTADLSGPIVIGADVRIGKGVSVRGPVSIGASCTIDEGAIVENSIVWRGATIEKNAAVRGCILGDNCTIKEGAAVQEGSVLGEGAVVASYLASLSQAEEAVRRGKIKFGTDGWRGIIADDFTGENVRLVAQSVVNFLKEEGSPGDRIVAIGYDNRAQSDFFANEAAKIVVSSGMKAVLSSQSCSSPALSYIVKFLHARGGLMITASHNPPNFNGLKIKAYYGGSASPTMISRIERHLHRLVDSGAKPLAPPELSQQVQSLDFREAYFGRLVSLVDLPRIAAAGLRIVVDAMHGSGSGYLSSILESAGCSDVLEIRGEHNPSFGGINPEPTEENMSALSNAVRDAGADVGIALDGDADRVGAMDSQGQFVDCHRIFSVLLQHLVEHRGWQGGVVKTVSTTQMIDRLCRKYNLKLYETPIGFKYICDLMLQEDILIGGEESGGIGIKNHIPERDGVLMGLLILEAMAVTGKRLEELIAQIMAEVGMHEYARIDLHPKANQMHRIISALQSFQPESVAGKNVDGVSRKDGTKILFDDCSWLLLRPSGTEPVVRVYAEAPTRAGVEALLKSGVDTINSS